MITGGQWGFFLVAANTDSDWMQMSDTTLSIEIKGLNLPEDVVRKLNSEIQALTLKEIAKLDLQKDLKVKIGQQFPLGIVIQHP